MAFLIKPGPPQLPGGEAGACIPPVLYRIRGPASSHRKAEEMDPDGLSARREGDRLVLAAEGAWTIETAAAMDRRLTGVDRRGCRSVRDRKSVV